MANFFEHIEPGLAADIERLSRLAYELRENRGALLQAHAVEDEAALMRRILDGEVAEHPGYENYLAARILGEAREAVRGLIADRLEEAG